MARLAGSISVSTVMELGMLTTRSYLTIFVMKLRWLRSSDGHAHAQDEARGVAPEHGLHETLRLGVEALVEVGDVVLREADARPEGMGVVVFEDAPRGIDRAVNAALVAEVGEVERADDVGADGFGHVVLAPVDVRTAGDAGGHEDVGGLDVVELRGDVGAVLAAGVGEDEFDALLLEQDGHLAAYPAGLAAIDENFGEGGGSGHGECDFGWGLYVVRCLFSTILLLAVGVITV